MNDTDLIKRAMSLLGSRKSAAKSAAAKANGKKGGRPRVQLEYRQRMRAQGRCYQCGGRDARTEQGIMCAVCKEKALAQQARRLSDPNIQPVKIIPEQIPAGHVAVRKTAYHYGRQGQVTLAHDRTHIVPEHEAIRFMSGIVSVTWPDGYSEYFDFCVSPAQASGTFGTIPGVNLNCGVQGQVVLSRLPNMAVAYHCPVEITAEQRASFVPHVWEK